MYPLPGHTGAADDPGDTVGLLLLLSYIVDEMTGRPLG
jgi:hypothetical protein